MTGTTVSPPDVPQATATPVLSLAGVQTYIAESHILQGVSFGVVPGRVTVLLGRNGVGKTTTLRTILGLLPASSGTITLDGVDITGDPVHKIVRRGIGYVPEDRDVFAGLTVEQNLRLAQRPRAESERMMRA
ncbi:MAG TPA: ATP-binding cassette domain-containing protein, partial [Thermomicrobiales bacterium]|nr:ATP-binding cassette domain-containing protein [Thermomicrobiales bacterium]